MQRNKFQEGFTLIEIIIVIAIIGILITVMMPKVQGREESAKITGTAVDMLRCYEAATAWKANRGQSTYAGVSIANLVSDGLWTSGKTNNYGGSFSIASYNSDTQVQVTTTVSNSTARSNIYNYLTNKGFTASKDDTAGTVTLTAP